MIKLSIHLTPKLLRKKLSLKGFEESTSLIKKLRLIGLLSKL
jgi:hypothetical protein